MLFKILFWNILNWSAFVIFYLKSILISLDVSTTLMILVANTESLTLITVCRVKVAYILAAVVS